jgi:hypothetical protein
MFEGLRGEAECGAGRGSSNNWQIAEERRLVVRFTSPGTCELPAPKSILPNASALTGRRLLIIVR